MKRTLLTLAMLPWLTSGCTVMMWHDGWAVETAPLRAGEPNYEAPVVTKTAGGGVTFEYTAVKRRLDGIGDVSDGPPIAVLRITNTVSLRELLAATNDSFNGNSFFPLADGNGSFATNHERLLVNAARISKSGEWVYPATECVIERDQWYWYVPPRKQGDVAQTAALSGTTKKTSVGQYVWRGVVTPFYLVADAFALPALWLVVTITGDGP